MSLNLVARVAFALSAGGIVFPAIAQQHTSHHVDAPALSEADIPSETGQSAFAAIAEIVRMLEEDPGTDWSKVDVTKLRKHLVDMNELTLESTVVQTIDGNTVTFSISGTGRTLDAIKSMVTAHAKELDKISGWSAKASVLPTGAALMMTADSDRALSKISALGFFGLMATGSHHQPHHLAIATGRMDHH